MSTNRTKTDWAYKTALKIQQDVVNLMLSTPHLATSTRRYDNVRQIAATLRRVSRCGRLRQAAYPAGR